MYQPKISDGHIRRLYQLKLQKKKPMTKVLDEILNDFFGIKLENIEIKEAKKTLKGFNLYRTGLSDYSCSK